MAMEARCYQGGDHRTKLFPLVYGKIDIIAYVYIYLYLAIIIAVGIIL